jgi:hypothetical protein
MGIFANVQTLPLRKEYRFDSRKEMIAFFKKRFNAKTPEQAKIVTDYIASMTRKEGNEVVISGSSTFAKIWWRKQKRALN